MLIIVIILTLICAPLVAAIFIAPDLYVHLFNGIVGLFWYPSPLFWIGAFPMMIALVVLFVSVIILRLKAMSNPDLHGRR